MQINVSFDENFDKLIEKMEMRYGRKMMDLDGIGEQIDMANFGKRFFSQKLASTSDISVDSNANVDDSTVVAYENELPKPYMRLNSLYLLWKECKRLYGLSFANRMVEGQISGDYYINDLSNVQKPYCYNFSAYDLMVKGLPFVKKIDSKPPQHLSSFCGQMIHFTSYASNQVMGAM